MEKLDNKLETYKAGGDVNRIMPKQHKGTQNIKTILRSFNVHLTGIPERGKRTESIF